MSSITMIAIEPCNNAKPGEEFVVGEREAAALEAKRLAKIKGPHENKMAPAGENKQNPTGDGGKAAPSSASQAGRASKTPTARKSGRGGKTAKTAE